ncbi:MAG: DNA recombination protein RmuC [Deltaproteobacteria bacterium]|nr:DNA recombination protein RmuC [Deltaproteobacteria bacterium]
MELVLYLVAGGTFAAVLLLVLVLQRLWALRLPPDRGAELLAHLGHLKADLAHQRQELASAGAQNFHQLHAMLGSHRDVLEKRLSAIQASTEHRLEQMRQTVDEKLQKTLEARLGESFRLVSERLEAVQKGLGEMKSLADGVGDLKRVMTNVKTRGTWGELQLRALLEDLLRPGEFEANFAPRQRGERVEFAVRLPGQAPDRPVYLPIDSKFPVEDYQRLVDALEGGRPEDAAVHGRALEDRIKACARDIRDKYLEPGVTTDFGILFLPFEGLYAEVLRRPGLVEKLQVDYRVSVAGPTTLGALLSSLRMGFSAVAIQRRSADIAQVLGAVKTEFGKFLDVLQKVEERLGQAQKEMGTIGTRSRALQRTLADIDALPEPDIPRVLGPPG